MSVTYEEYTVKARGFTLSKIIWRRFKKPMIGMHERVLNLNPGLAAKGPELPEGTVIRIPIDPPAKTKTQEVVQLWDAPSVA